MTQKPNHPCPCGTGEAFARCCLPLHAGERQADTAEELMRSRYSAYAVGDLDHVRRTWHPRTRPAALTPDPGLRWVGLEIVDVTGGGRGDVTGEVEFRAHYRRGQRSGVLRERSRFAVRAGRWFYVDGDVD
ncbi:zinc chelation protein SecC [Mycobacterium sp. IS-1742]|uniref:YchJ family protein n=1 Tax=Mycobacterium sp. IS-1742 TaxID=1772285 RepID=UPI000740142B|nr:YchJ family metal-binding protein [Mycobacterium sp. IS-1742]KUI25034.1 zinc chelation protein SecC [Mycobacterium sp. IS-1742]